MTEDQGSMSIQLGYGQKIHEWKPWIEGFLALNGYTPALRVAPCRPVDGSKRRLQQKPTQETMPMAKT